MMKITKRTKYKIKATLLFTLFILFLYGIKYLVVKLDKSPIAPASYTTKYKVRYRYIFDGDTAAFFDEEGNEISCRFIGVNAPEIGEEGYQEAKMYSDSTLRNALEIILELEPHSTTYDKYGRTLAWVWVDGKLLQGKLLENNLVQLKYLEPNYLYANYLNKINNEKNVTE